MIRRHPLTLALFANAVLLAGILAAMLRGDGGHLLPAAMAQSHLMTPAGAPAGGLMVVPAQFHHEVWGCYVLDPDRQILGAYQYIPGRRALELVASRDISHDRGLKDFNTFPAPLEIKALVEKQAGISAETGAQPPAAQEPSPNQ